MRCGTTWAAPVSSSPQAASSAPSPSPYRDLDYCRNSLWNNPASTRRSISCPPLRSALPILLETCAHACRRRRQEASPHRDSPASGRFTLCEDRLRAEATFRACRRGASPRLDCASLAKVDRRAELKLPPRVVARRPAGSSPPLCRPCLRQKSGDLFRKRQHPGLPRRNEPAAASSGECFAAGSYVSPQR